MCVYARANKRFVQYEKQTRCVLHRQSPLSTITVVVAQVAVFTSLRKDAETFRQHVTRRVCSTWKVSKTASSKVSPVRASSIGVLASMQFGPGTLFTWYHAWYECVQCTENGEHVVPAQADTRQ